MQARLVRFLRWGTFVLHAIQELLATRATNAMHWLHLGPRALGSWVA
jgi:hypothetical protein